MWDVLNDEIERMWKEMVVSLSKVISRHLHAETEENHEKPQSGQPASRPKLNPKHPKKIIVVTSSSLRSVIR
jgi:hypothetical protein